MDSLLFIFLVGLSMFLVVRLIAERYQANQRFSEENRDRHFHSPLLRIMSIPCAYLGAYLERVRWIGKSRRIENKLKAAGLTERLNVSSFRALVIMVSAVLVLGCIAILPMEYPTGICVGVVTGVAYCELWLHAMAKRRRGEIERKFPGMLDILTLSVEAGLDFAEAMIRVTHGIGRGPLKEELLNAERLMKTGASRREALTRMANRACVPALSSFVSLIIQSEKLGTSIGPILRATSSRLRFERFTAAERRGVEASQKILFPLILFIMPATFVVVFGPLVAKLAVGGFDALFR